MQTYVAFLRGTNVGCHTLIKMADLQQALLAAGLHNVKTYIQSGNVIFDANNTDNDVLYQSLSWEKFSRTTGGKVAPKPIYKRMTIRNYNTATKLQALLHNEANHLSS